MIGLPVVMAVVLARAEQTPAALPSRAAQRHWLTWQRVGLGVITLFALWGLVAAAWLLVGPTKAANGAAAVALGTLTVTTSPNRSGLCGIQQPWNIIDGPLSFVSYSVAAREANA